MTWNTYAPGVLENPRSVFISIAAILAPRAVFRSPRRIRCRPRGRTTSLDPRRHRTVAQLRLLVASRDAQQEPPGEPPGRRCRVDTGCTYKWRERTWATGGGHGGSCWPAGTGSMLPSPRSYHHVPHHHAPATTLSPPILPSPLLPPRPHHPASATTLSSPCSHHHDPPTPI
jgi:hypothetical protein